MGEYKRVVRINFSYDGSPQSMVCLSPCIRGGTDLCGGDGGRGPPPSPAQWRTKRRGKGHGGPCPTGAGMAAYVLRERISRQSCGPSIRMALEEPQPPKGSEGIRSARTQTGGPAPLAGPGPAHEQGRTLFVVWGRGTRGSLCVR